MDNNIYDVSHHFRGSVNFVIFGCIYYNKLLLSKNVSNFTF